MGGKVGCERRIEVFVKIQKQNWGRGGQVVGKGGGGSGRVGGQVGCERRIEVSVKIHKKDWGRVGLGVRVDVTEI